MFLREGATIDEKIDFLMQRLDSLDDRIHDPQEKIDGDIEELQNRLADQVWGAWFAGEIDDSGARLAWWFVYGRDHALTSCPGR